jgi:prevent-host-death family protein
MLKARATEVKNKFGEYLEKALVEPVSINKTGRNVAVLLAYSEYERLLAIEDAYWGARAQAAEQQGFLGTEASMDELKRLLADRPEES